jgi:Tfp pilus assembly protein PilO
MSKLAALMVVLGACLMLAACQPKPSSSASDEASTLEGQIERKIAFIEDLLGRRRAATRLIDALMAVLPEHVWLTEVEYGEGEARVKGIARSNILFIDYLSSLERSDALAEVALRSSERRNARDRETQEFELRAVLAGPRGDAPRASGPAETRLEELEKHLLASGETADLFRQMQRLASDAGLQMTKFTPEGAVPAGPYEEWSAAIEVLGDVAALQRLFRSLAGLPHLWVVDEFSFKTLAADDGRSPVRASIRVYCALAADPD